jgi:hypothetical protein
MPWSRKLSQPIALGEGRTFVTLRDAAEFMLELPDLQRNNPYWQFAVEAMLRAAQPDATTRELHDAEASVRAALSADGAPGNEVRRAGRRSEAD